MKLRKRMRKELKYFIVVRSKFLDEIFFRKYGQMPFRFQYF
jgi:hypothetical protein